MGGEARGRGRAPGGAASSCGTLHRARFVLPIVAPPIADGAILISEVGNGDREPMIHAVGPYAELVREHSRAVRMDHGDSILLPALVNAHTHLELSALGDGRIPAGLDFDRWLTAATSAALDLTEAEALPAIEAAIDECVTSGTGLVGDVSDTGRTVAPLLGSPLAARVFHEVIAFDPEDAIAALTEARARLTAGEGGASTRGDGADRGGADRGNADRGGADRGNADRGGAVRHSLAPHAPYTVSEKLLHYIRFFNGMIGRPASIHAAESPAEEEFFRTGGGPIMRHKKRLGTLVPGWKPPGESTVAYLKRIRWLDELALLVHCTQLTVDDIKILRRARATVCLCPRSNRALRVGIAPARDLVAARVPLALGTDSRASADSLSLFDELAAADADYGLAPDILLEAATRGGARALGFGDRFGELAAGRPASVIAVAAPSGTVLDDPFAALLDRPRAVSWVAGGPLARPHSASGRPPATGRLEVRGA